MVLELESRGELSILRILLQDISEEFNILLPLSPLALGIET